MRNLPPPPRDTERDDLRRGVRSYLHKGERRGHDITDDEIEAVIQLYDLYEAEGGRPCDPQKGAILSESLCDGLYSAYDKTQHGRTLDAVRSRVFLEVDQCPICGISVATELDHFLPRSVFKPLSIHTRNLVPLCHDCNSAKGDNFDEANERFIHAYYDVLPNIEFLQATVALKSGGLTVEFGIVSNAALPEGYHARLTAQMDTLNLHARYQQEVNTYLLSHATGLHLAFRGNGQDAVRSFLRTQAGYESGALHRNHWRPVLLRALAEHDEFTNGGFACVLQIPQAMIDDLNA